MILFLDFDGVLHPFADRHNPAAQFVYLPRLEATLRTMPQVLIVIASDWRERHDLAQLRGFFSSDIAARIIGVTPSHEIDASSAQSWIGCRQNEAISFLAAAGLNGPWVALDDTPEGWQAGAPLVVCADGFGESEAQALHNYVFMSGGLKC